MGLVNPCTLYICLVRLTSCLLFQIKMESEGQVFVKTEKEEIEEDDETQYLAVMPPCEEIIKSEG
jgi:hypothetical protein